MIKLRNYKVSLQILILSNILCIGSFVYAQMRTQSRTVEQLQKTPVAMTELDWVFLHTEVQLIQDNFPVYDVQVPVFYYDSQSRKVVAEAHVKDDWFARQNNEVVSTLRFNGIAACEAFRVWAKTTGVGDVPCELRFWEFDLSGKGSPTKVVAIFDKATGEVTFKR